MPVEKLYFQTLSALFSFLMQSMHSAFGAKFFKFQAIGIGPFIFCRCIISFFAISAGQDYFYTHQTALLFLALITKFNLPQIIRDVNIKATVRKNDF